jgi:hypothetical protein
LKLISSWLASFFSRPNAAHAPPTSKALALEKNVNLLPSRSVRFFFQMKRKFGWPVVKNYL